MVNELITILIVIVIFYFIILFAKKGVSDKNIESIDTIENTQKDDIVDVFYEKMRNGSSSYLLLKVYNEFDLMFIKSLFQSESIPYYTQFEHLNNLKPGININNYNGVRISILEEDYEDAMNIIEEYIKNKRKNNPELVKDKMRNILELIVGGWYVNNNSMQQIVIYKKNLVKKGNA